MVELLPLIFIGFGLGLVHALDADHIMAISVLDNEKPVFTRTVVRCARWALGHAAVLLLCGVLLFGMGIAIPGYVQKIAEMSVGVLLIALGVFLFFGLKGRQLKLDTHSHGDIVHSHWHNEVHTGSHKIKDSHKPVLVGMLHGLAGSAPALALIPAVVSGQLLNAILYIVLFSVGVMLAMLCFGFGLAHVQRFLSQRHEGVFQLSRHVLSLASIVFGGYWLMQAI